MLQYTTSSVPDGEGCGAGVWAAAEWEEKIRTRRGGPCYSDSVSLSHVSWACYVVGIAIILGSYVNVVSTGVGWIGWVIAMAGWAMQYLPAAKRESVATKLERLARLRDRGEITNDEYERAKAEVLVEQPGAN